ncbi:MAG: DoxX family protein [Leptospiraceae bacterium]|nr:DoxX family protein [Leptospiraceae bacterium]MCP5495870.1 DoxX family protein [Leptospiraceae bacterium]
MIQYRWTDLIFRTLFSLIFLGLGVEHLFSDTLIRSMMPDWMIYKRFLSIIAGLILLTGGTSILLGYKVKQGAWLLGLFLIVVTFLIHLPALFQFPPGMEEEYRWLWEVYQKSNLVKNLCLFGVCVHLTNHIIGPFSVEGFLKNHRK